MKLRKITVNHFRSIENVEINFPENTPVILFGANNVGKSNILKAIDVLLGERNPIYRDFEDNDFFDRDRECYPNISLTACFDDVFYMSKKGSFCRSISFTTNKKMTNPEGNEILENTFHFEGSDQKAYISSADRDKCTFIFIEAIRDIGRQFSYYSQYSILSKFSRKLHSALVSSEKKELDKHYENIQKTFEMVPKFSEFHKNLIKAFSGNVDGFEHRLDVDLSAYDPNNYFQCLRIIAKEGKEKRSLDEFGTGEQQILLMSFIKAYAETFKNEAFVFGIEEPEAHLHPLAQKWLAKNIYLLNKGNVQVIITTHSPEFLDIENLEGFVKVYKEKGITKVVQLDSYSLTAKCLELKSNPDRTSASSILPFYKSNTFSDQLKGFFARKILLVEGPTELFSLPNYFANSSYDLIKEGVEIVSCSGKDQIARNYRLFTAYEIECFCLFDGDNNDPNKDLISTFEIEVGRMDNNPGSFNRDFSKKYGYFGVSYEEYLRENISDYEEEEKLLSSEDKVIRAKIISENRKDFEPRFIEDIAAALGLKKTT